MFIDKKLNLAKNSIMIIAFLLLLIGTVHNWPHVYYTILRIVITLTALFIIGFAYVVASNKRNKIIFAVIFALIAILYNPIFPIHTQRVIWQFIDTFIGLVFLSLIFILNATKIKLIKYKLFH